MDIPAPDTLASLSDSEIATLAQQAEAHLAELRLDADEKTKLAKQALAHYESDLDDGAAFHQSDKTARRAAQAMTMLESFTRSASPVLAARADRKTKAAEVAELEHLFSSFTDIASKRAEFAMNIERLINDFRTGLLREFSAIATAIEANNRAAARHNELAARHGVAFRASETTIEKLFGANTLFIEELGRRFGRALHGGSHDVSGAMVLYIDRGTGDDIIRASVQLSHQIGGAR
jgi:hypothetical protein